MKTCELFKTMLMSGVAVAASSLAFAQNTALNPDGATIAATGQGSQEQPWFDQMAISSVSPETSNAIALDTSGLSKVTPDVSGSQRVLVVGCRFADTTSSDILDYANPGINKILDRMHEYFDVVSNQRVNFTGDFDGWHSLPKSSGEYANADEITNDCKDLARQVVSDRKTRIDAYRAIVMLFNRDKYISSGTGAGGGDDQPQNWIQLRFSGGTGGGWTSEALWAHELGHAFGLLHSTFPTRTAGNQYNDFQDAMSGFAQSAKRRWNFLAGGVCNGIAAHPECLYQGTYDNVPVHYSAFQKQRLGWLYPDQIVTHFGGTATYQVSAPTYDPRDESTLYKQKLVVVKIPYSTTYAYYAIEYRRGDQGSESNTAAFRRGWDYHEQGIRSDRVTVYLVEPDLYKNNKDDLGDANLVAVLKPGERFTAMSENFAIDVSFDAIVDPGINMRANVTVTTALPAPPTTVLSAAGMDGAWANQDVVAQLYAFPNSVSTPIANTYYGVDNPGCNEQTRDCAVYSDRFTVAGEGEHDVTYFSSDVAGGIEKPNHKTVRIDKSAPSTAVAISTAGASAQITISATDALSGVMETDYEIDGTGFKAYREPVTISTPGPHAVRIRSVDNAGNVEAPQDLAVNVPALPLTATIKATPSKIFRANGRPVPVHMDFRTDASGVTLRLDSVSHTGRGRQKGWKINTADVDGVVYAIRGATYTLKYTITDASGRTLPLSARVVVAN